VIATGITCFIRPNLTPSPIQLTATNFPSPSVILKPDPAYKPAPPLDDPFNLFHGLGGGPTSAVDVASSAVQTAHQAVAAASRVAASVATKVWGERGAGVFVCEQMCDCSSLPYRILQ
jgi:hypothetical protein